MVIYSKHLSEPWFSLVLLGIKTVEGRLNKGSFAQMVVGDIIEFKNDDVGIMRSCKVEIQKITKHRTFADLLQEQNLQQCLPGIGNIENGIRVYYSYYTPVDESKFGVLSFDLKIKQD